MSRARRRIPGRVALLALVVQGTGAATATVAAALDATWATVLGAGLGAGGLAALLHVARKRRQIFLALEDGVRSFRAGDYSLRLAVDRDDEIGALVDAYNAIGDALRAERRDIYQRELLLDMLLHGVPVATVLVVTATSRVIFSNRAARQLLGEGRRLEGRRLQEILAAGPAELDEAIAADSDALFTVRLGGGDETFKAGRRAFHLGGQEHSLILVERLTPELRRREVEAWKNAVRIVNHELNNSLAPIRSLVHSARHVLKHPEHGHRLEEIFAIVEERVSHLAAFLEGYAAFARLPTPRKQPVAWSELLERVQHLCAFVIDEPLPDTPAQLDPSLMEQVRPREPASACRSRPRSSRPTAAASSSRTATVAGWW